MSPRHRLVLGTVLAVLLAVLMAVDLATARFVLIVPAALLLPGLGWARQMQFRERGDTIALAVVLSVSVLIVVGMALASGTWSVNGGLAALAVFTVAGFVPVRTLTDRAITAVRPRMAEVPRDGPTWVAWFAATLRRARTRRRRDEQVVNAASEVWVVWYNGVERRTAEARAQQAAAVHRATQEWVTWYQRTQLLSIRRVKDPDQDGPRQPGRGRAAASAGQPLLTADR